MPLIAKLFLGRDFNRYLGKIEVDVRACRGYGLMWEHVLDFVLTNNFGLVNNFYKKREGYLVIFKSGNNGTDYFIVGGKI